MTASEKKAAPTSADTGAGIAVASVWLVLYIAIVVAVLVDHHPGDIVDVASAAR